MLQAPGARLFPYSQGMVAWEWALHCLVYWLSINSGGAKPEGALVERIGMGGKGHTSKRALAKESSHIQEMAALGGGDRMDRINIDISYMFECID